MSHIRAHLCAKRQPCPCQLVDRTTRSIYWVVKYGAVKIQCRYEVTADCGRYLDCDRSGRHCRMTTAIGSRRVRPLLAELTPATGGSRPATEVRRIRKQPSEPKAAAGQNAAPTQPGLASPGRARNCAFRPTPSRSLSRPARGGEAAVAQHASARSPEPVQPQVRPQFVRLHPLSAG